MPGLTAYIAGLPESALDLIHDGLEEVYGEVMVDTLDLASPSGKVKFRKSNTDNSVVLVVFGEGAYERGKSFANGLYESSKFHRYENDRGLAGYLNKELGATLEIPEEAPVSITLSYSDANDRSDEDEIMSSSDPVGVSQERTLLANDSTFILENKELHNLVKELQGRLEDVESEGISAEEANKYKAEIRKHLAVIEQYDKQVKAQKHDLEKKQSEIDSLRRIGSDLEKKVASQAQTIRIHDNEVNRRENAEKEVERKTREIATLESILDDTKRMVETMQASNKALNTSLESATNTLNGKQDAEEASAKLTKQVSDLTQKIQELETEADKRNNLIERYTEHEKKQIEEFDQEVLDLKTQHKAEIESIAAERDLAIQQLLDSSSQTAISSGELESNAEFESSIFRRIANASDVRDSVPSLGSEGIHYKNITFAVAGSSESVYDARKRVLQYSQSLSVSSNSGVLVVDISSETNVDYIYGTDINPRGIEWAEGNISYEHAYSRPSTETVPEGELRVISIGGTGYVNDVYLLTVDWFSRFRELENSGFKVVIYLGDISSLVGRVLYKTFSPTATTNIYTRGNLISLRNSYYSITKLPISSTTTHHIFELVRTRWIPDLLKRLESTNIRAVIDSEAVRNKRNG